jgi:hypothetical protein
MTKFYALSRLCSLLVLLALQHLAHAQLVQVAVDVSLNLHRSWSECQLQVKLRSLVNTCDGATACLDVTGGTAPYTIVVNGEHQPPTTTGGLALCLQRLQPGAYTVKVTDAQQCTGVLEFKVQQVDAPLSAIVKSVSCHNGSDGSIDLHIPIDVAPIFFKWTGPNGFTADTEDLKNLKAGVYSVRVFGVGGVCYGIGKWEVQQPSPIKINISIAQTTCGKANVCATVTGGTAPYRIWGFAPLPTGTTNENFLEHIRLQDLKPADATLYNPNSPNYPPFCRNDLPAGNYYVVVQDANGCFSWQIFRVNPSARFERQLEVQNISCTGQQDGKICFKIAGNNAPYKTTLAGPAATNVRAIEGLNGCFDNLTPGEYLLTTTDNGGCSSSERVKIMEPSPLEAEFIITENDCRNGASGCLKVSGGTAPYYVSAWIHPNPTAGVGYRIEINEQGVPYVADARRSDRFDFPLTFEQGGPFCTHLIPPGDYIILVWDANGCYKEIIVHIPPSSGLQASWMSGGSACNGIASGCLTVEGGTQPYDVHVWAWNSPLTVIPRVTFDENGRPRIEGGNRVEWRWSTPGIAPPYQICADSIPPGFYWILVVDANRCYKLLSVTVPRSEGSGLQLTTRVKNVTCNGNKDGQVYLVIQGGEQPYIITFNGGLDSGRPISSSLTIVFDSLKAGVYKIEVKDKNGCTAFAEVKVTEPEPLRAEFIPDQSSACNAGGGCVQVKGGTRPYKLLLWRWDDPRDVLPTVRFNTSTGLFEIEGAVRLNIEPNSPAPNRDTWCYRQLPAGNYLVLVIDNNGCYTLVPFRVETPNGLRLRAEVTHLACNVDRLGSIKLFIGGGQAPYQIKFGDRSLTTRDSIVELNGIAPGTYTIYVNDNLQCSATITVTVNSGRIEVNLRYDKFGSYACVNPTGGTAPYKIEWLNLETGAVVSNDTCVRNLVPSVYLVTIRDQTGCSIQHWLLIEPKPCEGGVAKVNPESIVSGEGTKFSLSGQVGISIQWQFKTDYTDWLNIPGATGDTYLTPPIHTSWDKIIQVRAQVKCADGTVVYSTETAFKIRGSHLLTPVHARVEDPQLFNPTFRKAEILALQRSRSLPSISNLVYPTVSRDVVRVRLGDATGETVTILIVNQLGQVMNRTKTEETYPGMEVELSVGVLASGTYFVRIENGKVPETHRIVVQ